MQPKDFWGRGLCCLLKGFLQSCPTRFGELVLQIQVEGFGSSSEDEWKNCKSSPFFPGGCDVRGVGVGGWISLLGVEPHLDSHERPLRSLLFPSAARPHAAILLTSLLHSARASVLASRLFTRPLLPCPCPSVRALFFFYLFISLAGHWFGFAIPSLSLGGASVVAEENRYPFYVFIISQIKKLMN